MSPNTSLLPCVRHSVSDDSLSKVTWHFREARHTSLTLKRWKFHFLVWNDPFTCEWTLNNHPWDVSLSWTCHQRLEQRFAPTQDHSSYPLTLPPTSGNTELSPPKRAKGMLGVSIPNLHSCDRELVSSFTRDQRDGTRERKERNASINSFHVPWRQYSAGYSQQLCLTQAPAGCYFSKLTLDPIHRDPSEGRWRNYWRLWVVNVMESTRPRSSLPRSPSLPSSPSNTLIPTSDYRVITKLRV